MYGERDGKSLVGKYGRGIGKMFVVWHCKDAFEGSSKCIDGVCGQCKILHNDSGHSCGVCNQNIKGYKCEDDETMMKRKRDNWDEIAPKKCAICGIEF